jgi:hypothetical protein
MTCRRAVHACIVLTLIAAQCLAQTGGAIVGVAPQTERVLTGQFAGKIGTETRAVFGFGPIAYAISEKHRYLADDPTVYEMGEGYIGMPAPSSANWYHTGFLFVQINGHHVQIPATSVMSVESGDRAILDMVWHDPDALVRTRFFGLPGENWLGCEVKVEPINEITSLTIALRCYPSFFTSAYNRDGARRIQTPSLLVEEGAAAEGALAENPWAFYYDEVFDVARGEGDGPCAMLALPVDGATIRYEPGSYAVNTTLYFPPDTRTIGFAFWDYKGLTNADALADLQGQADTVLATLETADLTPKAVAEFDIAAVRASLEEALASAETREALGERIGEVEAWLAANEQMEQPGAVVGVAGQEELLGSLDDYNSFQWEVKLIKLLNDL